MPIAPAPSFVYLIESQNGLVKIGCSQWPKQRETMINQHSPVPARLVACWPGRQADERVLHRKFHAHRNHNEWFRIEGELTSFVEASRGLGVDRVATWDELTIAGIEQRNQDVSARLSAMSKARWADPAWRERHRVARERGRAFREARRPAPAETGAPS